LKMSASGKRTLAAAAWPLAMLGTLAIWVDTAILTVLHVSLTPALDQFFNDVSEVADATVLSVVTLVAYGVGRAAPALPALRPWLPWWERIRQGSLLLLLTLLTGGPVTLALKHMVARARPSMLLEQGHYGVATPFSGAPFNSFPSSHAFTAFAVAGALAHLLPAWRVPLWGLAAIAGLCRVLTLEHFPSDVLASAFIAAWCVGFWAPRVHGPSSRSSP
jgi:membrane-associated phospholipid phosphatase